MDQATETVIFGGGCFWCTEAIFERLRGVISVQSGYAGGSKDQPGYADVSAGRTGHAEVVRVVFDPRQIHLTDLLKVFFATHDPTSLNKQGADEGPQYRSVIFYTSEEQKQQTETYIRTYIRKLFDAPIVTELKPLSRFFLAEDYHQKYYDTNQSNPYCQVVIDPKLAKLRQKFTHLLKP